MRGVSMLGLLMCILACLLGCQPAAAPEPPTVPPPEDLSTWSVPELVQPPKSTPHPIAPLVVNVPAGAAEKVYAYKPGVAVDALVGMGMPLDIVLEPGE